MATIACPCGARLKDSGEPNAGMTVVRNNDRRRHDYHVWRTYQLSDVERNGMLPERGSAASEEFHESLYAALDLEGEL